MAFLTRDELRNHVKPCKLRYKSVKPEFPRSNHKLDIQAVTLRNMQHIINELSLDNKCFEAHQLHSKLFYEDFFDPAKVTSLYLKEV